MKPDNCDNLEDWCIYHAEQRVFIYLFIDILMSLQTTGTGLYAVVSLNKYLNE